MAKRDVVYVIAAFESEDALEIPGRRAYVEHAWHLYVLRLRPEALSVRLDGRKAERVRKCARAAHGAAASSGHGKGSAADRARARPAWSARRHRALAHASPRPSEGRPAARPRHHGTALPARAAAAVRHAAPGDRRGGAGTDRARRDLSRPPATARPPVRGAGRRAACAPAPAAPSGRAGRWPCPEGTTALGRDTQHDVRHLLSVGVSPRLVHLPFTYPLAGRRSVAGR